MIKISSMSELRSIFFPKLDSGDIYYHALPKPNSYKLDPFHFSMRAVKVAHQSLRDKIANSEVLEFIPTDSTKIVKLDTPKFPISQSKWQRNTSMIMCINLNIQNSFRNPNPRTYQSSLLLGIATITKNK